VALKIATFNINGIKARLPRLVEWLEETQPDIACLQELKSSDETMPTKEIEAAGYGFLYHGQKGFNGVAILARGAQPAEVQRGLAADVHGVRVASIYLPNGNPQPGPKFDYKLRWMARLRERAKVLLAAEVPAVLVGDYNVIPHNDDVWDPRAMAHDALMQPDSRDAFFRILGDGWTDALRSRHPAGHVWTYWDYQAGAWQRDHGFRIDHLLLSPAMADRLIDAGVDKAHRGREKASDHAPTWALFG
jgi:exodeoxyribonuclease-3